MIKLQSCLQPNFLSQSRKHTHKIKLQAFEKIIQSSTEIYKRKGTNPFQTCKKIRKSCRNGRCSREWLGGKEIHEYDCVLNIMRGDIQTIHLVSLFCFPSLPFILSATPSSNKNNWKMKERKAISQLKMIPNFSWNTCLTLQNRSLQDHGSDKKLLHQFHL